MMERENNFGKDLPSKSDLIKYINNGQIPFLNRSNLFGQETVYLIIPFTGAKHPTPTYLKSLGDAECFSYYTGDGKEMDGKIDNGLRKRISLDTAEKIHNFLSQEELMDLKALNHKKAAVELEIREKISIIKKLRKKESKLEGNRGFWNQIYDLRDKRHAITQHGENLNALKRDLKHQIEKSTKTALSSL